jgi:RNA polymerase sigma factor (sigma-70 family)
MAADPLSQVARQLRRTAGRGDPDPSDADLLGSYLALRDEDAFADLVRRHGPTVLGVCRRVLGNAADAEDAFQATFLVLARRAAAVRHRRAVGSWLYGVAYNVARRARAMNRRRLSGELAARTRSTPPAGADVWHLVENLVDDELSRLPDDCRAALVACALDGRTIREAAEYLGWPPGTVATRLARGRELLARRLARRGVAVPAGLLAAAPGAGLAAPVVPADLVARTAQAGCLFGAGRSAAGAVSASAAALANGTLRAMVRAKLRVLAAVLIGLGLVGGGLLAHRASAEPPAAAQPPKPTPPTADRTDAPKAEPADRRATRVALAAHDRAAAVGRLPRLDYQVRYRHGVVDSMRAVDASVESLTRGLTDPVLDKDWKGYEAGFSWDEKRFVWQLRPVDATFNHRARFWTKEEAWDRGEANDHSSVQYVRMAGPGPLWKMMILFDHSYLRLTPHRFWWGWMVSLGNSRTMSPMPPDRATWRHLGVEESGGEACDVVDSVQRGQRLWVGQKSGHVRAAMTYYTRYPGEEAAVDRFSGTDVVRRIAGRAFASPREFGNWLQYEADEDQLVRYMVAYWEHNPPPADAVVEPNELIRFEDYREVAPGVWLPFRETRTFPHVSDTRPGKSQLIRSELRVTEARTDRDLGERYARLLPKDGDPVQDQRFAAPVDYKYRADRTDDEIRKTADAAYQQQLKDAELVKRLVEPFEAMVGTPAPALPAEGWVGGKRPDVAGKPYLLHFWATWCGPCKNDLPLLKRLAEQGVVVVGMHPAGTPAAEVGKAVRAHEMSWPSLVAAGKGRAGGVEDIAGYRVGVFPYAVLVDGKGRVAAHGQLSTLVDKLGVGAMLPPRKP